MYADREHRTAAARPAVDASSRLFHQITQNQEDRRLYEEASIQMYQSTPDSAAKRHGMLKPTINGKTPKPWMSMKSVSRLDTATPSNMQTPEPQAQAVLLQHPLLGSAPAVMAQTAVRTPAAGQQKQSGRSDTLPHSEGLFGRQRAAKRQHSHLAAASEDSTPAVSARVDANGVSNGTLQPMQAAQQSSVPLLNRSNTIQLAQIPAPEQRTFDALDRLNARMGYGISVKLPVSHTPVQPASRSNHNASPAVTMQASVPVKRSTTVQSLPVQLPQEAQRPMDALDRFNKRHKSHGKTPEASPHGSVSTPQQTGQLKCAAQAQAQRPLDALARFNMRKGHKPFGTSGHEIPPDVQESDVETPAKEDTAAESQQSQTTSVELEPVLHMQTRPPIAKESSESSQTPDALDKLNTVLLQRRQQRMDKRVQSVPAHARKGMRAFDDDVGPDDVAHLSSRVQSEPRMNLHQHQVLTGCNAASWSAVSDRMSARLGRTSGV